MDINIKTQSEVIEFIKTWADTDRLKVIGSLVNTNRSVSDIASDIVLPKGEVEHHLRKLMEVGMVSKNIETSQYSLNFDTLLSVSKEFFATKPDARKSQIATDNEETKRYLERYVNRDGSLKDIPSIRKKKQLEAILDYVSKTFKSGRIYTEKEVNQLLKVYHNDYVSLRRYLVDYHLLGRTQNGSKYWLVNPEQEVAGEN